MFYFSFRPVKKWVLIILVWILYWISELGTRNNCRVILTEFVGAKIMLIFALTLRQLHCDTDDFYLFLFVTKALTGCRVVVVATLTNWRGPSFAIYFVRHSNSRSVMSETRIVIKILSWIERKLRKSVANFFSSRPKTCRTSKSPILANSHLHNIYFPRGWN